MVQRHTDGESGSESESSRSASPFPQTAPTPGHSLEQHSRSNSPVNRSDRSRSHSINESAPESPRSRSNSGSRSGSNTPAGSVKSRSRSPYRSPTNSTKYSQGSRSRSGSPNSPQQANRSRSRSIVSNPSHKSNSRSPSGSARSASRSPAVRSHSRSRSKTPHSHRSRSGSRSNGSRSASVSPADKNRSRSATPNGRSRSGSRSHSGSRSRSRSHDSAKSQSGSEPEVDVVRKRSRNVLSDSGNEGEEIPKKVKKSALIDTDSEEDEPQKQAVSVSADALFGDADDISTDEDEAKSRKGSEKDDNDDRHKEDSDRESNRDSDRRRSSGSEDEEQNERKDEEEPEAEVEVIPERRIDVEIPKITADLGKDIHFVKLPNFLSVDTRPFDKETYEDEIDEEETLDEEGRQRIKLKVSNTIRWREYLDDDGKLIKESNARMVKWSDGSMSLHLGNEIFDVYKQPLQGDHNHLFIRQGTGLQGQAVFRTKLTYRPHSTESFTHKKMTMSLADRSQKKHGVKILTQVGYDPDTDRMLNLKKEEEKLRQAIRAKSSVVKPKRNRETVAGTSSSYREDGEHESDDEGAISIAAIKNKYKKNGLSAKPGAAIYSSDDDESDLDMRKSKKFDKSKVSKALRDSDDEDNEAHSGSGSENEPEPGRRSVREKSVPRGNQIESDIDD